MLEGNSIAQIMGTLGINYTPAIQSGQLFARSLETVNAQLSRLQVLSSGTALSTGLADGLNRSKVIVDQYGRELLRVQAATNQAVATGSKTVTSSLPTLQQTTNRMFNGIESRATQHRAFMDRMFSPQMFAHHLNWMITGVGIYGTFEVMKEGLVDIEKGMKGLQTVLPEIAHDQEAFNKASEEAIDLMQKYGASVDEVMSSARSLGRMYKDTNTVMGLTNDAILLNVIDNVRLEDAVKGNEAALSIYGKELKNTNEVLAFSGKLMDSLTRLSHESMAQASDLIQILQQSGGAAKEARVELDQLLGLGASAVRATGLQGAGGNLGRMLRTVFVQLSAPTKAVEEDIEKIGVSMRKANGELRSAYDIVLDLALATKDASVSQEDLNNAILRASSGKFQYSKLAALVGQFDEIVKNTARSVNSQGITMQMAAQQLDTIERHARMLKGTLIDTFSGAGDAGLRSAIKGILDTLNQLIMGFNKVSSTAVNASLGIGAIILAGKMVTGIYSRMIPIMGGITGATAQMAAASTMAAAGQMSLATATNVSNAAMSRLTATTALATGGLTLLLGGLAYLVYKSGEAERKQLELNQANQDAISISQQKAQQYQQEADFLDEMSRYHDVLKKKIESGKLSEEEAQAVKKDMIATEEALEIALGKEASARLKAADYTKKAIQDEKTALKSKSDAEFTALRNTIKAQEDQTQAVINGALERIKALQQEGAAIKGVLAMEKTAADIGAGTWNLEAATSDKAASFFEKVGLSKQAENARIAAENARQLARERTQSFKDEVASETERQVAEQERAIANAEKELLGLRGSALFAMANNVTHTPGGGDDDDDGSKNFGTGLRESANEAKLAMDEYNNAIQLTDTYLQGVTTRERIFDLQLSKETVPTLEQTRQKYGFVAETIALNTTRQEQLHKAADAARAQLADLNSQMDDLTQRHNAGTLSAKNFNTAVGALRPTIQQLENQVAQYGNAWWEAEYNSKAAIQSMKTFYLEALREQRDAIEDAYNDRLKQIEDEIEAEEEATQARIDRKETEIAAIDEEANSQIAAIQELMDALEGEDKQSEREEAEREHNQKMAELLEQKQYHELRTGTEHQEAIAEIEEQMAEEDHDWALQQQEWAREDQRDEYQDQIDAIREEAELRQDAIRDEIDDIREASEDKKEELQDYYEEVQELLSDKTLDMIATLATSDEQFYQRASEWMRQFAQGIRDGSIDIEDAMDEWRDIVADAEDEDEHGSGGSGGGGSGGSGGGSGGGNDDTSGMTWQELLEYYETHESAARAEIARAGRVYSQKIADDDIEGARAAHRWADQIRRAIGEPMVWDSLTEADPSVHNSYKKGGPILYDQDARVHAGEYVLTAEVVDAIRMMKPLPTDLGARMASAGSGGYGGAGAGMAGSAELLGRVDDLIRIMSAVMNSPRVVQIENMLRADNVEYGDGMDMDIHSRSLARAAKSVLAAKGA